MQLMEWNQVKGFDKNKNCLFYNYLFVSIILCWLQDKRDEIPFKESTQVQRENTKTKEK